MILKIGYKLEDIDFIKEEAKYYFEKVFDVQVEECEWEAADLKLAIEKNDADLDRIHIVLIVVYANCDMYSPVYMGS